ncbi:gag-pol polyprotein [Tanacetum coccineum]
MTRSSTNELFTPYKEPEREFRSSRRHFKTLSLDELRSPNFNLLSDQEYSEEEEAKAMAKTMEQYMSKTRTDYGTGVARSKIDNKDQFELKGQFLKELRENTFSGSDNEDANEYIEKVLEIIDLFHVSSITVDQLMLRVYPISLTGAVSRWLRNEPTSSIKTCEDLKTKLLNKYCPPGRTAKKMKEINNFQQEPDETLYQAWERFKELLMKCPQHYLIDMQEEGDIERQLQGTIKGTTQILRTKNEEIRATTDAAIRNQGASIKTAEIQIGQMSKLIHTRYAILDHPNTPYPLDSKAYGASHINNAIPQKEKDPGSFTLPCSIKNTCFDNTLVDLGASVNVMPISTYLNLGLGELAHTRLTVELADRIDIKVPLILERPFLSTAHAMIDVYKRKITLRVREERIVFSSVKPASSLIKRVYMLSLRERMELDLEARLMGESLVRNQGDDLMLTIEEGKIIKKFRTRDKDLDTGIDDYPSYCDDDKKIHLDYMDAYRYEGMGDVIFGEPFLREVGIKTKQFEGIITLYKSDDEVTYQMVRSHPRFKRHTNEQCNKIPPLLKVSEKDEKNGILHAYQKLKGFYKGVLNLGPDYLQNEKTEEWLTQIPHTKLLLCPHAMLQDARNNVTEEGAADGQEIPVDVGIVRIEDEVPATIAEKAKGSKKKMKDVGGANGSNLPPKKLRSDHGTSGASASTGGKSVTTLERLLERSTLLFEVGVTAVATLPFITSSVSLTPERDGGGRINSVTRPNLRTQHQAERFVVLSDSPCHSSSNAADAEVSFVVRSLILDPPIMTTAIATTVVAVVSSILVPRAGNEPAHASIFVDSTSAGTVGLDIADPSQPAS